MVSPLPTICVLGSLNIDLVYYLSHHPLPGETLTSTQSDISPEAKVPIKPWLVQNCQGLAR